MKRDHTRAKPRGWRRRMRAFDRLAQTPEPLPPWVGPPGWDTGDHMPVSPNWPHPLPIALRRNVVAHLVGTYDRWREELRGYDEPLYLGIWLFDPYYGEDRVMVARGMYGQMFTARHLPGAGGHICKPPSLYDGFPTDLSRFEWTHFRAAQHERASHYEPASRRQLLREARQHTRTDDGDIMATVWTDSWYGWLPEQREWAMPLVDEDHPGALQPDESGRFHPA